MLYFYIVIHCYMSKNIVPLLKEIIQRVKQSVAYDDDAGEHTEDNLVRFHGIP